MLASLRREVDHLSAWPIGSQSIQRLLLYGIIPPFTWVAAAFVEMSLENWL